MKIYKHAAIIIKKSTKYSSIITKYFMGLMKYTFVLER